MFENTESTIKSFEFYIQQSIRNMQDQDFVKGFSIKLAIKQNPFYINGRQVISQNDSKK